MKTHSTVFEREAPHIDIVRTALAQSRLAPFWTDSSPLESYPALSGDLDVDLAIVGGGFTGLWTAVRAKERNPDRSVALIESHRLGWAASGRNGGFCEASLTHGRENGIARWPCEYAQLEQMGLTNLDEIEQTITRYGMDVEFERTGAFAVAVEEHQVEWLRDDPSFIDREAIYAEVHSPTYLGASFDAHGTAMINPTKLVNELARVAASLGVQIFEDTPALALVGGSGITTPHGRVTARKIALATNAFRSLLKRNALRTVPVYDYVLMTEPLTDAQLASIGWRSRAGIADVANQFHYYRLSADNRILFGGYDAVYHFGGRVSEAHEDRSESFERLASHFFTTFPQLAGVKFSHRWAGAIDTCSRFCAFFGTARRGRVAYALGFTGLGVAATRFAADVMLDLLDGLNTERTRLTMVRSKPMPFPPEPLASLAINMVRRALDRADHNRGKRNLFLRTLDFFGLGFDS